jgi:hypothetical protein
MSKSSRSKRKQATDELKRLQEHKLITLERVELLKEIVADMKASQGVPSVPLGGLVDDLFKLNPFRAERVIPFLLTEYEQEYDEITKIIAEQN